MAQLAAKLGYSDLKSFDAKVQNDPALRVRSGQQMLDLFRGYVAGMYVKLPQLFGRLPKARLEVEPTEAFLAPEAPTANYQEAAPDGLAPRPRAGQRQRPHVAQDDQVRGDGVRHEGVPGHHLQVSIAQELPSLPPAFWRNGGYSAFSEKVGRCTPRG